MRVLGGNAQPQNLQETKMKLNNDSKNIMRPQNWEMRCAYLQSRGEPNGIRKRKDYTNLYVGQSTHLRWSLLN